MNHFVKVENVPDYAYKYNYFVVRLDDGVLWFYGAWDDKSECDRVRKELGNNALVIHNAMKEDM